MASLTWYIDDSRALLRDNNALFTSTKQLTRWINMGRREIAKRTGCIRLLLNGQSQFGAAAQPGLAIPGGAVPGNLPNAVPGGVIGPGAIVTNSFNAIPGQEMYPFKWASQYLRQQYAGVKDIIDIIELSVTWGAIRPTLEWRPWEDLQAYARSYSQLVTSYPWIWSTNGDGENQNVWLFPVPSTASSEMEFDCLCTPADIYSDNDYDIIPESFQEAVKYWAAGMSFLPFRTANAALMFQAFMDEIGVTRISADRGKSQYYYWDTP